MATIKDDATDIDLRLGLSQPRIGVLSQTRETTDLLVINAYVLDIKQAGIVRRW
jgi:hypothetical protein